MKTFARAAAQSLNLGPAPHGSVYAVIHCGGDRIPSGELGRTPLPPTGGTYPGLLCAQRDFDYSWSIGTPLAVLVVPLASPFAPLADHMPEENIEENIEKNIRVGRFLFLSAEVVGEVTFHGVAHWGSLANTYLTGLILSGLDLSGLDLSGADLSSANLNRANLSDADLSDANLSGADLTDADLTGANLTEANLTGADLTDAILSGVDLTDADLTGVILTGADLDGVEGLPPILSI